MREKINMGRRARIVIFLFVVLVWIAGCVPQPKTPQELVTTATTTPDPLYSIHCIRHSGKNDLCYEGSGLLGNRELLEKAAIDYCENVAQLSNHGWCILYIWNDEASVAQTVPLTEAESRSQIAAFVRRANIAMDCFTAYNDGEIVYKTSGCK